MSFRSLAACFIFIAVCFTLPVWAKSPKSGIEIVDAWAPPSLSQNVGIAYVTLRNIGKSSAALSTVTSPDITDNAELHTHHLDAQGVIRMRRLNRMAVPVRGTLIMQPGGHHVMLFSLKKPLRDGDNFSLRLGFEDGTFLNVLVPVSTARLLAHIKSRNTSDQRQ